MAVVSTAPHGCPHPTRQCNGASICHEMKSHFIPQMHSTSRPESRTLLALFQWKDNSELPDSVWFRKVHDYFEQLNVRRSTSTGFAFIYMCLNLSQHEAFGELGKQRPRCHPWQLEEQSRPPESPWELPPPRMPSGHVPRPCLITSTPVQSERISTS